MREHLSPVEGLVGGIIVVEETHVDKVDEQAGSLLRRKSIVCCPLVEDQQDKVTKQARHEDNLWDEAQKDVQWLLEVPATITSVSIIIRQRNENMTMRNTEKR